MKRHRVESSNIAEVGYDPEVRVLEIQFHSGAVYQYPDVVSLTFAEFMNAPSMGKFFAKVLRPLPFVKLAADPVPDEIEADLD